VSGQLVLDPPHRIPDGAVDLLLVHDGVGEPGASQPQELDVCTGQVVPGPDAEDQQAQAVGRVSSAPAIIFVAASCCS
jgi:hypothetical protein